MTENGHAVRLLEPASLREAMSRFATGVVVLAVGGEHIHGMTANAFTSVSLEPPLVLCCIAHSARMHDAMTSARKFGVSIMSADQEDVARHFADKNRTLGAAEFDAVDWWPGPRTGAPLLAGALAWLECELTQSHTGGDHSIFLATVSSTMITSTTTPLLYFASGYRTCRS